MAGSQVSYEHPEMMYAQLNPQQRSALAQEFLQGFQKASDPKAQQFTAIDPKTVTPQQLAAMPQHARQEQPGVLGRVMRHPIATAVLGGFAAYEIDKPVIKKPGVPDRSVGHSELGAACVDSPFQADERPCLERR